MTTKLLTRLTMLHVRCREDPPCPSTRCFCVLSRHVVCHVDSSVELASSAKIPAPSRAPGPCSNDLFAVILEGQQCFKFAAAIACTRALAPTESKAGAALGDLEAHSARQRHLDSRLVMASQRSEDQN